MPVTALPARLRRLRVIVSIVDVVFVFGFVVVVDTHETAGEGHDLSEGDEESFVDLSCGIDVCTAEEEYESPDSEDGCHNELYVQVTFHQLKIKN